MQEFKITSIEENQNIMTYLRKLLPVPSISFLKKMARKKVIKLNNQKISGEETLKSNDIITLFFSKEMFNSLTALGQITKNDDQYGTIGHPFHHILNIIKEDDHILLVNKPIGLQLHSKKQQHCLVDDIEYYLSSETKDIIGYKPGITNYLDKNSSGIIITGKDLQSAQSLNFAMYHNQIETGYKAIIYGDLRERIAIKDYIISPVINKDGYSEISITTSKGLRHAIRPLMDELGYPIIGDKKYGNTYANQLFKKRYQLRHQLLHAGSITFNDMPDPLGYMDHHTFYVDPPTIYKNIHHDLFTKH